MVVKLLRNTLSLELLKAFADGEGIRLRKEIRHELVMVGDHLTCIVHGSLRLGEANELGGDHTSLVHQLVEAMLTICARFSQDDGSCLDARIKTQARFRASLAIALHVELLNVGWES